jgi:hypothetical protein
MASGIEPIPNWMVQPSCTTDAAAAAIVRVISSSSPSAARLSEIGSSASTR